MQFGFTLYGIKKTWAHINTRNVCKFQNHILVYIFQGILVLICLIPNVMAHKLKCTLSPEDVTINMTICEGSLKTILLFIL